jgi:ligand-binding sensor domain-containing protein
MRGFFIYMLITLLLTASCIRNSYDLSDPFETGKVTLYSAADGLPGNDVGSISLDASGSLWFTFRGKGVAKLDDKGWTNYTESSSVILSNDVTVLGVAPDGNVVIGTTDGISILSGSNTWSSYIDPGNSMYITSIKVASNGWIWLGSSEQGFYVNKGSGFIKVLSAAYAKVNSIEEGNAGNIFIGTDNGIIKWDGSTYTYIKAVDGLPSDRILALSFATSGRMWIGTGGKKDAAWIDSEGVHKLDLMAGSDSIRINAIHEDRLGNIWFATSGNGLIKYDGLVPVSYKRYNGFPSDTVNCIGEDKYGNLWFGIPGKGVAEYKLPAEFNPR